MVRTAARGRLFAGVAATAAMAFVAAISVPVSSSGAAVSTSALPTIAGLNLGKTEPTTLGGNFPLKSKPPTGKTICYVNNGNPYAQLYLAGMNQAAPALGWTVKVVTANEAQPSTYGTAILSSIQAGCNAVIEAGANLPYWRAEIPTAQKAHVIIEDALTSDTAANNLPGVIRAQKSEFAQYYQGVVTGMGYLRSIRQYYPKGNAGVMMMLISQFKSTEQPLNNGVAAAIHAGCPSCKVSTADFDLSAVLGPNGTAAIIQALRAHPGTDYLELPGAFFAGLLPAFQAAGLNPIPRVGGTDPLGPAVQDLKSSNPQAIGWTGQPFAVEGTLMLDALARYYTGTKLTDPWDDLNGKTPPLDPKITPLEVWLTHSTINQYESQNQSFPPDYISLFKSMWHVG
jgi:ABC-type sugar transport system substrate-binding protein